MAARSYRVIDSGKIEPVPGDGQSEGFISLSIWLNVGMPEPLEDIAKTQTAGLETASGEDFSPGQVVAGKYRIVSLLGRGGIGSVYKVEQVFLGQVLALKTLNSRTASDQLIRRFQNEARAASSLRHPNLVKVTDFGLLEGQQPYLVMELVDGSTLSEHLKDRGVFSLEQIVGCFAQVCLGLSYAHEQGIVHRDIKPSNIMISRSLPFGAEGFVKVVDFGIAKLVSTEDGEVQSLTSTGEIFGSPLYMSPEQCTGASVDHRSDIYSLGCVLFETLTGTTPFVGQNALSTMMLHQSETAPTLKEASLGKDFPPALEQVVAKMLAKNPADRYQNLGVVANDLAQIVKGAPALGVSTAVKKKVKVVVPVNMTRKEFQTWLLYTALGVLLASGFIAYFAAKWQSAIKVDKPSAIDSSPGTKESAPLDVQEKVHRRSETTAIIKAIDSQARYNDFENKYNSLRNMAEIARPESAGQVEKMIKRLSDALDVVRTDTVLASAYTSGLEQSLGLCYAKLKRYAQAEEHLQKAMRSSFRDDAKLSIGETYEYMAEEKKRNGEWSKSLQYREDAIRAFTQMYSLSDLDAKLGEKAARHAAEDYRCSAALCFENFHDCARAAAYCDQAKLMIGRYRDDYFNAQLYMLWGAALSGIGKLEQANSALETAVRFFQRVDPEKYNDAPLYLCNSYETMAGVAIKQGRYDLARASLSKAQKVLARYRPIGQANSKGRKQKQDQIANDLKNLPAQNTAE